MSLRTRTPARHADYTIGVDVSTFNGNVDWDDVAEWREPGTGKKVEFAYIRTAGPSYPYDTRFVRNWRECKRVGILRGPYVPFHAEHANAKTHLANLRKSLADYSPLDLTPAIDIEKPDNPDTSMAIRIMTTAVEFKRGITSTLFRLPMIYSGSYMQRLWNLIGRTHRSLFEELAGCYLWAPDYRPDEVPGPGGEAGLPALWDAWDIHQFSSRNELHIPGASADSLDLNRFDGGPIEFNMWRVGSFAPFLVPLALGTVIAGAAIAGYTVLRG